MQAPVESMNGNVRGWMSFGLLASALAFAGCAPEGEGTIKVGGKGKKFDVIETAKSKPAPPSGATAGGRAVRRGAMGRAGH